MQSERLNEIKAVAYKFCEPDKRIDVGMDPGDEGCEFIDEARKAIPELLAYIQELETPEEICSTCGGPKVSQDTREGQSYFCPTCMNRIEPKTKLEVPPGQWPGDA